MGFRSEGPQRRGHRRSGVDGRLRHRPFRRGRDRCVRLIRRSTVLRDRRRHSCGGNVHRGRGNSAHSGESARNRRRPGTVDAGAAKQRARIELGHSVGALGIRLGDTGFHHDSDSATCRARGAAGRRHGRADCQRFQRAHSTGRPRASLGAANGHGRGVAGRAGLRRDGRDTAEHDTGGGPTAVAGSRVRVRAFFAGGLDRLGNLSATTSTRCSHRSVLRGDLHRVRLAAAIDRTRVGKAIGDDPCRDGGAGGRGCYQSSGASATSLQAVRRFTPPPLCVAWHRRPVSGRCSPRSTRPGAATSGWRCG